MKLTIGRDNFKRALGAVEKIASKNISLPILNNILLRTENGRLCVSATNLEVGIRFYIGAKIDEVGEVAVPARILSDFIHAMNDEKISLITKNNTIHLSSDNFKTTILGVDPKEFPIIPKIESSVHFSIPASEFRNGLLAVMDSVSLSESRPELAGVYIHSDEKNLIFASTDIFRLSEKKVPMSVIAKIGFILPRVTVMELIRLTGDGGKDINIRVSDNQIACSNEEFEFVSRLVDGTYPDYVKVIPDRAVSKVLVDKKELEQSVRLAGLFTSNISDILIKCAESTMVVQAKNSDKGELEAKVSITLKEEPFDISLNFQYLLDGLKHIDSEKVVLEFTGQGSPFILRPSDKDPLFTYLIMPLRS